MIKRVNRQSQQYQVFEPLSPMSACKFILKNSHASIARHAVLCSTTLYVSFATPASPATLSYLSRHLLKPVLFYQQLLRLTTITYTYKQRKPRQHGQHGWHGLRLQFGLLGITRRM